MSGDHGGSQCGLSSLLPMSCRGRAAAFARDLQSRLRNLGVTHSEDTENSWLTHPHDVTSRPPTSREHDTFYDFELECESPSSPVDEFETNRSPTEDQEPPFYDVDSEPAIKEQAKLMLQQPDKKRNGFKFPSNFHNDSSPVKLQPSPRENGNVEKSLYSPITFEGCARQSSIDEVDSVHQSSPVADADRLCIFSHVTSTLDSDSEFESAKSDPSEGLDENFEKALEIAEDVENLSLTGVEIFVEEEVVTVEIDQNHVDPCEEVLETTKVPTDSEELEHSVTEVKDEEHDETEDDRPQRVRRCSSLKTGKTPPGTPGRKKIVRFADVLGLDLADVKTFMDEIPVIPKSAYDDLTGCDVQNSPPVRAPQRFGTLTLVPLFQLPHDVTDRLEKQNVCLESARVCDGVHVTVCGSVRVRNLDFHKTVHIRYTMNRWKTYTDLQATYVPGSCDGYSDRFQFVLYVPCITSGQRLEVAVRFQCKGQQFWDNNFGANYCFDCLALGATLPVSSGPLHPTIDWHPSFY